MHGLTNLKISRIYCQMFLKCSTCFVQHNAHHQKLKTAIADFGFTYVFGCWPLRWPSQRPATKNVCKTRACNSSFELLMMGGVSSETCWAFKKHLTNKCYYTVASCWFFLWDLYYDAWIHEHEVNRFVQYLLFASLKHALCCTRSTSVLNHGSWAEPQEAEKHVIVYTWTIKTCNKTQRGFSIATTKNLKILTLQQYSWT